MEYKKYAGVCSFLPLYGSVRVAAVKYDGTWRHRCTEFKDDFQNFLLAPESLFDGELASSLPPFNQRPSGRFVLKQQIDIGQEFMKQILNKTENNLLLGKIHLEL